TVFFTVFAPFFVAFAVALPACFTAEPVLLPASLAASPAFFVSSFAPDCPAIAGVTASRATRHAPRIRVMSYSSALGECTNWARGRRDRRGRRERIHNGG